MIDWFIYWFMFPACIGISGTAMLTPLLILAFPMLGVTVLTPAQAVGMALLTEFFGSGLAGYRRRGLIDYKTGWRLLAVSIPTITVFSLISHRVSSLLLKIVYGAMMLLLATYLFLTAPGNVRNHDLRSLPETVELIPRRSESRVERLIRARDGTEYRYKVCDPHRGYLITAIGAAMSGLISVGLGELEMPNLVKRCKIPVAISAATSVFVIAITVLSGSIMAILTLVQESGAEAVPWNLVVYTVPGAMIGGQLGSSFQGRGSSERMERFIAALFVIIGAAFLSTTVSPLFGW